MPSVCGGLAVDALVDQAQLIGKRPGIDVVLREADDLSRARGHWSGSSTSSTGVACWEGVAATAREVGRLSGNSGKKRLIGSNLSRPEVVRPWADSAKNQRVGGVPQGVGPLVEDGHAEHVFLLGAFQHGGEQVGRPGRRGVALGELPLGHGEAGPWRRG